MKYKEFKYSFLVFLYIFSFNFENLKFLVKYGNVMNIGVYNLMPLTFLLYILGIKVSTREMKYYINYILYLIFLFLLKIYISNKYFLQMNVISKSIQLIILIVFQYLTISVLSKLMIKIRKKTLKKIINFNIVFILIKFIFEFLQNLHNGHPWDRIILYTSEASESGYVVLIFFIIAYYINDKKLYKNMLLITGGILEIFVQSKGAIICFFMSFFILFSIDFFRNNNKQKMKIIMTLFSILIIFYFIFYNSLKNAVLNDLKIYGSIITRVWSLTTGSFILIKNPCGVLGEYLNKFISDGKVLKNIYINKFPFLNYNEINSYLENNAEGGVPKATFFFNMMVGGLGYIIFQFNLFKYILKKNTNKVLELATIFVILSFFIYTQDNFTGTTLLLFSILIYNRLSDIKFNNFKEGKK